MFNEAKFPFTSVTSSVSIPNPPKSEIWLSNLLYLHSSNQPSILGPFSSHTSPLQSSSSQDVQSPPISSPIHSPPVPNPTPPAHINDSISIPHAPSPSISIPTPTLDLSPPLSPVSAHSSHPTSSSNVLIPINTHPMTTRSKNGISKPKPCYKAVIDYTSTEPPSYKVASKLP